MLPPTRLYRHDELQIWRPYGVDVDEKGWLWEGCGADLAAHHLGSGEMRTVNLPEMDNTPAYQVFCWHGKLVITLGEKPFYVVYDPAAHDARRVPIPGPRPIVWYGTKTPGDKVMLFDRANSHALMLDAPDAQPRIVHCRYEGDFAAGAVDADGLVNIFLPDPPRLLRFDPLSETFVSIVDVPGPEAGLSGRVDVDGVLYCADSAGGRLLPFERATGRWLDPIPTPDYGKVYGFIGGGFGCGGKCYYCLSTYAHRSRLDTKTGKLISPPPGAKLTVDGREPRFLDRFLVFDPRDKSFDYLIAPPQPDGVPLLCYSWTDGFRFAITGHIQPFDETKQAGTGPGAWIVLESTER